MKLFKVGTWLIILVIISLVIRCNTPTYYRTNQKTYNALLDKDYERALKQLDKNDYIRKKHSSVLYGLEKGRILLLASRYQEAFEVFESIDRELDGWDQLKERDALGTFRVYNENQSFLNTNYSSKYYSWSDWYKTPRKRIYRPYHFERIMIHYNKAICLLMLNQLDEAEVEARQLIQLSHNLDDLHNAEPMVGKYISDALPQLIAGLLYELNADDNNAWIDYGNAIQKMNSNEYAYVYGTKTPQQLKRDLLRLSDQLEFDDQLDNYRKQFNYFDRVDTAERYLIVIVESGLTPIKEEDYSWYSMNQGKLYKSFDRWNNSVLLSTPVYKPAFHHYDSIVSIATNQQFTPQMLFNANHVTTKTYNYRFEKESEEYLKSLFVNDTLKTGNSRRFTVADTRHWQTLPAFISYTKVPVIKGRNSLFVFYKSGAIDTITVNCQRKNSLYLMHNY